MRKNIETLTPNQFKKLSTWLNNWNKTNLPKWIKYRLTDKYLTLFLENGETVKTLLFDLWQYDLKIS